MQRGQLITKGFAGPGRHDGDGIPTADNRVDDFALTGAELRQPEGSVHEALQGYLAWHTAGRATGVPSIRYPVVRWAVLTLSSTARDFRGGSPRAGVQE